MTNPNDPAFAHDGHRYLVEKELLAELGPEISAKIAAIDHRYQGLSKREWFSAMMVHTLPDHPWVAMYSFEARALDAVRMADALIAELSKQVNS